MNRLILVLFLFSTMLISAQTNPANTSIDVPWTVSAGVNFVDNDGFVFSKAFSTKNWNFKNPFYFSAQRKWRDYWAAGLSISFNELQEENSHNNGTLEESVGLFAVDASALYIYDHLFTNTQRVDPFEAYVISGFGITSAGSHDTATFNFGLGFNFWIIKDFGLRLQTMGKIGFNEWQYLKNYIQHSIEFIARF